MAAATVRWAAAAALGAHDAWLLGDPAAWATVADSYGTGAEGPVPVVIRLVAPHPLAWPALATRRPAAGGARAVALAPVWRALLGLPADGVAVHVEQAPATGLERERLRLRLRPHIADQAVLQARPPRAEELAPLLSALPVRTAVPGLVPCRPNRLTSSVALGVLLAGVQVFEGALVALAGPTAAQPPALCRVHVEDGADDSVAPVVLDLDRPWRWHPLPAQSDAPVGNADATAALGRTLGTDAAPWGTARAAVGLTPHHAFGPRRRALQTNGGG